MMEVEGQSGRTMMKVKGGNQSKKEGGEGWRQQGKGT